MRKNSMANSPFSNSEFTSPLDYRTKHHHRLPSPPSLLMNQPLEHLPFATPPAKRTRGRPPGSKNKPKHASIPGAQLVDPFVKLVMVNVPPGNDVIESIIDIARRGRASLTILNADGMIASVTLRNAQHGAPTLTLHGPFTLLSLTGSYIYGNQYSLHLGATPPRPLSFGINLSTLQGQIFGGVVDGKVIAADGVNIVTSTFKNPEIYKYVPEGIERDGDDNNSNNNYINFNGGDDLSRFNMTTSLNLAICTTTTIIFYHELALRASPFGDLTH
ncbi:AT-hook motif nuclear-localized protein 17, partial [Mucuna pruriens]